MKPWLLITGTPIIAMGIVVAFFFFIQMRFLSLQEPIRMSSHWQGDLGVSEARLQLPPETPEDEAAIVATLRNDADEGFSDVGFHVEIFDAEGKLVDALQPRPGWFIPPKTQLTVRLHLPLRADPRRYARWEVQIVRAFQREAP